MPRSTRILFPALAAAAMVHMLSSWLASRAEASAHHWDSLGLEWLGLERFASNVLGSNGVSKPTLIALAVAGLVAFLVEVRSGEDSGLRKGLTFVSHPLAILPVAACVLILPNLALTARPTPMAGSPNLLFVMVDTWRADHAGFLGYERDVTPKLDSLTEGAVVFERAVSQSSWTKPAVATLMTGQVPSQHGAVSNPIQGKAVRGVSLAKSRTTFLEVLRAMGWDTAAWSSNPNVVPARGFAQGTGVFFDSFNDPRRTPEFDPGRGEHQVQSLREWLGKRESDAAPFAAYLHVMDPHYPYRAPAPFGGTFAKSDIDFDLSGKVCDAFYNGEKSVDDVTPQMLQHVIDTYDEELLYMDNHVGGLIEEVLGEHPNTVVVLVSDHGEEFLEHGQFGHGIGLWEDLVHVPLAIWAPNLEAGRIPSQVRLMDVPSTVLELLGLAARTPQSFKGKSLMSVIMGAETAHRLAPMESGGDGRPTWQWRGISNGETKVLRRELDLEGWPAPPLAEWERDQTEVVDFLFQLESDPEERSGPAATDNPEVQRLFELMQSNGWYVSPADLFSNMRAQRVDLGGNIRHLQSLGYAGEGDLEAQGN
ncbi:MAG: arylsulfatase A-like enzyme [Planctomycetota bacterium]|jgi:arylsulfatase A-like enzyme